MSDFNIQFEEQDQVIRLEFEQAGGGAVKSVNGKTGVVVLDAADVGAYVKPSGGIPKTDLASSVQTSLGKADSAYQKPSGGIPASDMASGAIPTVDNTLTTAGAAADAKKTGDEISDLKEDLDSLTLGIDDDDGLLYLYVNGVKQGEGIEIGGSTTRYTITYNLPTNIESSNTASRVSEGSSYATTISSTHPDYQIDDITVTMGGTDITATAVLGNDIGISSVTGNVSITVTALFYPSVDVESPALEISSGGTGTLKVKLHAQPTQSQTVSVFSDNLTLSTNSLTFTTSNWNTYQSVTVTAPSVEYTEYYDISVINSDPLMTESTVMVTVKELGYDDLVDTTIPTTGQHTVTSDDFTTLTVQNTNYLQLIGYSGQYSNIIVPATIQYNGNNYTPIIRDTSFANNTTLEYVTVENGVVFSRYGAVDTKASGSFMGCSNLIGVDLQGTALTEMPETFKGCSSLKFVKGLENQTNLTSLQRTFESTAVDYIQDISALKKVTTMQQTFHLCSSLKKVFGVPMTYDAACTYNGTYDSCTSIKKIDIPTNATIAGYAMSKISDCTVNLYNDGLTTSNITNQTFYQCSNITVYCTDESTTEASLLSAYGSNLNVTIKNFGGASTPFIAVWGDSISSPNKPCIEWPQRLQTQLGTDDYIVRNLAISGETASSTTARQGGFVTTVGAFEIPATATPAEIIITENGNTTLDPNPVFTAGASYNPCTINGVRGMITKDGDSYYFTRLEAGTAVSVPSNTVVTSDNDTVFNAADNVMIFYLNGNSGYWDNDADKLLEMFQKAVDHFEDLGGTKYIVAGPAANKLLKTTAFHDAVMEFEPKAATAFGSHWLNLREYEIQYGLSQNNLTASALDTERMADGLVPASLVGGGDTVNIGMYNGTTNTDENHPNVYGSNTIMLAFYEKGVALGYWSAVD